MPDFEALLLREQKNPNATILEFFLSEYEAEDVVILVEGADDPLFYYDFITEYLADQSLFFFTCGGKQSLLKLKDFLSDYGLSPQPKKLICLTDKDFDDFLGKVPTGVFQTQFYSIENYFCNPEFFEYVVRKFGAGRVKNSNIPALVDSYKAHLDAAAKLLIVPMAVICALRERGTDIDLDIISCADLIEVDEENKRLKKKAQRSGSLSKLAGTSHIDINCGTVRKFACTFAEMHFNYWLRGKYGLQMMRIVLRLLCIQHHQKNDPLPRLGTIFGAESLRHAKAFLRDLPSLKHYAVDLA